MVSELLSQGKANEPGGRGWGEEREIIHILTMSSFPSSSTTKSSPVLNLTSLQTVAENMPHCKLLHGFPLQTSFPLFTVFFKHMSAQTTHSIR